MGAKPPSTSDATPAVVRVGALTAPWDEAQRFVTRYLNTPADHWSYPAYDAYPGGPDASVSEQDLFAPTLLNAGIRSLETYYALCGALRTINERLAVVPGDVDLADATDEQIADVARVIGVIDGRAIPGVQLTTYSKILHRKRPRIFPLYDPHIEHCYQHAANAPVPAVREPRTWSEFAVLWLKAVRHDLRNPPVTGCWETLAALTPQSGQPISPLRALDIVGWGLGQPSRAKWKTFAAAADGSNGKV
ncbi:hypothetical protein GXB85_12990 [Cellulomonas sp. APG4]|uniref:DUF6308 family protein n=1 Tax=Cellulomonas sp. APG4 TaxID=1538656 RepID=UPI00137B5352|nr:DUF6308 family protein [Cellulomonas sp. APG4]NCT91860.1 hypothetical protein [Cellulomonas sp. APG4]